MGTQTAPLSFRHPLHTMQQPEALCPTLRQPHSACMQCCLHNVADVNLNYVVARCPVGEDGKPASPVVASLAVLANGELLRKTSSGVSVMLGRGQLEARESLHQASAAPKTSSKVC